MADQVSRLDPHSLPKRNFTGDVLRCRLRIRIVPGGIPILFTVYDYVVIAGRALPSARRMMIAGREEFLPHVLRRKVVVPFDNLGPIGLSDYLTVPYRSDHNSSLGQRFGGSNHIRRPRRACRTKCG